MYIAIYILYSQSHIAMYIIIQHVYVMHVCRLSYFVYLSKDYLLYVKENAEVAVREMLKEIAIKVKVRIYIYYYESTYVCLCA